MKSTLYISFLIIASFCLAQNQEKAQKLVSTVSNKSDFEKAAKKPSQNWLWHTTTDTSNFFPMPMTEVEIGQMVPIKVKDPQGNYVCKVIQRDEKELVKVNYIFLDGKKSSSDDIETAREDIMAKYKDGVSWGELAKKYGMDGNKSGKLNWFAKGDMEPEFDEATRPLTKGQVAKVEVPSKNWFYVVVKTNDNKTATVTESACLEYK